MNRPRWAIPPRSDFGLRGYCMAPQHVKYIAQSYADAYREAMKEDGITLGRLGCTLTLAQQFVESSGIRWCVPVRIIVEVSVAVNAVFGKSLNELHFCA